MGEKYDDETLERVVLDRLVHIANYGAEEGALCAVQVLLDRLRQKRFDGLSSAAGLTCSKPEVANG